MGRTIKRMTAVLLSVIIMTTIFIALPGTVNAVTIVDSGVTGKCMWTLDDNGTLTISGNGDMYGGYNYTARDFAPWNKTVKKAIILPGVTSISKEAFFGASQLESVTISDTVKTLGIRSFRSCTKLKHIIIPESVTNIQYESFEFCSDLEAIVIPGSVGSIGKNTFNQCNKLTIYCNEGSKAHDYARDNNITTAPIKDAPKFDVPQNGTTGDCTWIIDDNGTLTISGNGEMGSNSNPWGNQITSVIIEDGVTSICKYAFSNCTGLTSAVIGNDVEIIDTGAFSGCTGLTGIALPDSVTGIGRFAFTGCTGLTNITIPDNVTIIDWAAFSFCKGLTDIRIGNSVNSIGAYAFYSCTNLESITIPNIVTSIGEKAFLYCNSLTSVTIPYSVTEIGNKAFGYINASYYDAKTEGFTIYGYNGTAAQQYADDNGFTFVSLGDIPIEPTTVEPTTAEPTTVEPTTAPAPADKTGDVNGDGNVNGADAGLLSRYTSGWKGYADKIKNMSAADINGDGNVNGADAGILSRYASGWTQYARFFS